MRSLILLLLFVSSTLLAQKSKSQLKVADDLVEKLSEVKFSASPIRLAIVPFTSSAPSNDSKNTFGEYLTELVIGKVSENAQFKLFERSRLDAIFKENELMLSGMMKPSEAIKIGQLLPIDMLFSGTYTKLKSYVDVSGRLIDVVSGEILISYSGRVKMNKNIKTLFPDNPPAQNVSNGNQDKGGADNHQTNNTNIQVVATLQEPSLSEEEACKLKVNEFKQKLNDFSTTEKIDAYAREAMAVPFDNLCGKLHYELMYAFTRYKIQHEPYRKFLLETLDKIALPSQDDRSATIIEFLSKDHDLSITEWKTILKALARVERGLYSYLHPALEKADDEVAKNRIDEVFGLVKDQKMGLPQPFTYDYAFYQLMQSFRGRQPLLLYTYERYADPLVEEPKYTINHHWLYLQRMYEAEKNPETKTKILRWVADYFRKFDSEKTGDKLYDFAFKYRLRENKTGNKSIDLDNEETKVRYPENDLLLLINLCEDKFAKYAREAQFASQFEDRVDFCVKYGIPVPGAIPTMAEADQILKGNDLKEQERVLKLLIQMDSRPKPLENTLIKLFDKRSLEDKEQLITVQTYAMEVLGNIKTSSPKAINYMISKIASYNYKESDKSQAAITKIGKPAVGPLITKLKETTIHEGGLRYKLVVLLGKNGKDAKEAEPLLLKLQKENTNKDISYALEAALQEIRQ